jgi:hypothetical protein
VQAERFPGCNAIVRPPVNQDGHQLMMIGEIPVMIGLNGVASQWRPTRSEIDILNRGGAIRLYQLGEKVLENMPSATLLEVIEP